MPSTECRPVLDDKAKATIEQLAERDPDFASRLAKMDRDADRDGIRYRFALRLRLLIVYRDLKQREVAKCIGHTEKTVSRWAHGDRLPDYFDLRQLSKTLGVTSGYFIDDEPAELDALNTGEL